MENLHWRTSLGGETVSEQRVSNCDGIHQSTASALEQLPTAVIRECLRVAVWVNALSFSRPLEPSLTVGHCRSWRRTFVLHNVHS